MMNPPYGRLRLADDVRADFAHVLYGHANLYGMFMASGEVNTAEHGVLACLVPTSFTAGRYFHKLRGHLGTTMPMHAMNFVDGRNGVFNGVLQETCLVTFKRQPARRVKITRSNGHVESVGEVPVPKGDGLWLLPRASTGPLVWNRRKADLHSRPGKNRAMILWGADIDGGEVHRDSARDKARYLALSVKSDLNVMLLEEPAVLVQRTTAPEQCRRIVAADLSQEKLYSLGGRVVVENHVNVLRPTVAVPLIQRVTLARLLQTKTMDRLMRCISGSVAVSSYEIDSLPLPDAGVLASWEGLNDLELEHAVALAYTPGAKI
jgi:adenine-specific DNA-methyltransferase